MGSTPMVDGIQSRWGGELTDRQSSVATGIVILSLFIVRMDSSVN